MHPDLDDVLSSETPELVRRLADQLDMDALVDLVVATDMAEAWPDRSDDADLQARLRQSVTENLTTLREFLAGRITRDQILLAQPLEFGRWQAHQRLSQATMHQSYRVGFLVIWDQWVRHLMTGGRALGADPAEILDAVKVVTRQIFRYQDIALSAVAEDYSRMEDVLRSSREHLRQGTIRQLLTDRAAPLPMPDMYQILGYDLAVSHVAVLVPSLSAHELGKLAASVRVRCNAMSVSYVEPNGEIVTWFGRGNAWGGDAVEGLMTALAEHDVSACVSVAASGIAGFVDAYRQVGSVRSIRLAWRSAPRHVVSHADVALEVLLGSDQTAARRFVSDELGGLAKQGTTNDRLCETLQTWFTLGSHVATAEALGLHEHTVRNRLRQAEGLLGHPIASRRTEVQVALRLRRLFRGRDHEEGPRQAGWPT